MNHKVLPQLSTLADLIQLEISPSSDSIVRYMSVLKDLPMVMDEPTIELALANFHENTVTDPSSALTEAFRDRNIAGVKDIIQANKDKLDLYETVQSCIMQCAHGGRENAEILVALMKYPHVSLSLTIETEEFIGWAIVSDDFEIFEAMLAVGWDPCSPLKSVGDALTYAVMKDRLPIVSWLLDHGAKYDANEDWQPFSILARAARFASPVIIERLLAAGAPIRDSRALEMAVFDGRTDSITCLLDNGGDIDEIAAENSIWVEFDKSAAEDGYGAALHVAAKQGHLRVVQLLVNQGANVELRDSKGRTALDLAIMEKHSAIIDFLGSGVQASGRCHG